MSALGKTIYVGTFIHPVRLTELEVIVGGAIGVDERGRIAFVWRGQGDDQDLTDPGWSRAKVVKAPEQGFFFPGFIGVSRSRSARSLTMGGKGWADESGQIRTSTLRSTPTPASSASRPSWTG